MRSVTLGRGCGDGPPGRAGHANGPGSVPRRGRVPGPGSKASVGAPHAFHFSQDMFQPLSPLSGATVASLEFFTTTTSPIIEWL